MLSRRKLIAGGVSALILPKRKLLAAPALSIPGQVRPSLPSQLAVPFGLVGYWGFDPDCLNSTSAFDLSGNGNTGTLNGSPTLAQGQVGNGLLFNGSGNVSIQTSSSIALIGAMSITAWVKLTNFTNYNAILSKTIASAPEPWDYYLASGSGVPSFLRGNGSTSITFTGSSAPALGVWQFIAATDTGGAAGTCTHYLNNSVNGSGALNVTGGPADGGGNAEIGSRVGGGTQMTGVIDDVRLYNRALAPWEVIQIYQAGLAGSRNAPVNLSLRPS